jgi:small-conductance mechanosensitive channel
METNYLLSNKYKKLGWVLFILGILGGIFIYTTGFEPTEILKMKVLSIYDDQIFGKPTFFKIVENGVFDELVSIFIIVGGFLVGFTKEKIEDEFIYKLRKDSLVWALVVNYSILLVAVLFVYDMTFLHILFFNMFTPLLFFVTRFSVLKSKYLRHEE